MALIINISLIFFARHTESDLNVFDELAEKYDSQMSKKRCQFPNNDSIVVGNYIKRKYNIPVVSELFFCLLNHTESK